jgi:SAM-dependent MidA family methyltransferase
MAEPRTEPPSLADRLRSRIRENGPMPFRDFMEAALYDPAEGFFQREAIGERADFVTAPHLSPAFGVLMARQIHELWALLDKPDPFVVIEVGAGDGTLAGQVLEFLSPDVRPRLEYVAVERTVAGRRALAGMDVTVAGSLDDVPRHAVGCVIANELLDNVPFRWVRREVQGLMEMHVDLEGDGWVLVPGPLTSVHLEAWGRDLVPGEERIVQQDALELVRQAATLVDRGYLWIADYGFTGGAFPREPHGYRGHRLEGDVLADPGSRDITAGVDFDGVTQTLRDAGLTVWGPVAQRDALVALGYPDLEDDARRKQTQAADEGRGLDAARIYSARQRASLLVERSGLGDFLILAAGRGVTVPPASVGQVG